MAVCPCNKEARNAKDMAVEKDEEETAKDVRDDKQRPLASGHRIKKEHDDTVATLQKQWQLNKDIRARLKGEQSRLLHMRDAAIDPNNTTAVISIQFDSRRTNMWPMMMFIAWH